MISIEEIKELIVPKTNKLRPLDKELIMSFYSNNDRNLIQELKKFQNQDLGFGNGLEADIQLPLSNVASTCIAINILEDIKDLNVKKDLNKEIVQYLESAYDQISECFHMVPKDVDHYPHAVWWNYDTLDSFTWGNPNPEIIGYLYQNKQYLNFIDINHLINKTIKYINTTFKDEVNNHNLLSILRFYNRMDEDVKNLIKDELIKITLNTVEQNSVKWGEYTLEPYKVAVIDKSFLLSIQDILQVNLEKIYRNIKEELPSPNWNWYQYLEEFEKVKKDWIGLLTYDQIKALRINRK